MENLPDASYGRRAGLRDQVVQHGARHVGQPEVAAAVAIGQFGVVDAEQVQDGGVQVVDVDRLSMALKPKSSVAP